MNEGKINKWIEDIDSICRELPRRHKNLYFNIGREDFIESIHLLKNNLHKLEDYEIMVQLAKIIASVGDAHTTINMSVYYLCPLEFYWFSDGIFVINTDPDNKCLLYKKITHVDGIKFDGFDLFLYLPHIDIDATVQSDDEIKRLAEKP